MRIVYVGADYPELEKHCPNFKGVKAGLKRLGYPHLFLSCRPTFHDFETIQEFKPDLIVYGLLDMVKHKDWRDRIRKENPQAKIVMWYGDLRLMDSQITADCSELDAMFVSNNGQNNMYKKIWKVKECHFLPLGAEPLDKPMYNEHFAFDFIFIGGKITSANFIDRALEINRFEENGLMVINSFEDRLRAKIMEKMPQIYSSAKICLDISHFTNIDSYTSNRFWNIPAMYGFPLTKRFPNCEKLFKNRVYFDTFEEALELRDYYLEHEEARKAIVEKAHKESYENTYDIRFKKMFDILNIA